MGIKERQARERRGVRQSILAAARELFATEGYRNVSIRKIADRIEYSPAAIYSYFSSKDDIYLALTGEGFRLLAAKLDDTPRQGAPLDIVRAGWWAFYEFSKEQPAYFELLFVDRSVPAIADGWAGFEVLHELMRIAGTDLQRAIDAGELPGHVNPAAAIHIIWAALVGAGVIGLCDRLSPGEDRDQLARDVLNAVIAGLQAGSPTTFVPVPNCPAQPGVPAPSGVPSHES